MTRLRVLVTGFGAFPGAPFNPTPALVRRLLQLRRPALDDIELAGHVFQVSYAAVDRDLAPLLATRPDAILSFGLAQRTPWLRIETRARNRVTTLWPDVAQTRGLTGRILPGGPASLAFGPITGPLLQAARGSGAWAEPSHDAGRYLCNYLCWRLIEARAAAAGPAVTAFVHVPQVPRPGASGRRGGARRPGFEDLVDAGEAMLLQMVAAARRRRG
jgi:pyroglutamyl-peptidase